MAETAAHLVDHVFPKLPVRQWVLSWPKRLRYFLQRELAAVDAVLHIFLRNVEAALRAHRPGAGPRARLGAQRPCLHASRSGHITPIPGVKFSNPATHRLLGIRCCARAGRLVLASLTNFDGLCSGCAPERRWNRRRGPQGRLPSLAAAPAPDKSNAR